MWRLDMWQRFLIICLLCALANGCSQQIKPEASAERIANSDENSSIELLVAAVRSDPTKKPLLARALMKGSIFIIPDPHAPSIVPLKFDRNEYSFIPVFSDAKTFNEEAYGTGFENRAIPVDTNVFASILKGDEIVILNPGHRPAIEFTASELKVLIDSSRLRAP
jgi:hypothetical protein